MHKKFKLGLLAFNLVIMLTQVVKVPHMFPSLEKLLFFVEKNWDFL